MNEWMDGWMNHGIIEGKKYFLMCFLGCLLHTFARMSLLLRNAVWARRTLARGLFGFGKASKQRQQIQEAQSGFLFGYFISRNVLRLCRSIIKG